MKRFNIKEYIHSYIMDTNDFITYYDNHLYAYNYIKLETINSEEIEIVFNNYKVNIIGSNLIVKKMTKEEMLIKGIILKVEFIYE